MKSFEIVLCGQPHNPKQPHSYQLYRKLATGVVFRENGRTDRRTDGRTDGVKPVYPPTTSLCGGYNYMTNVYIHKRWPKFCNIDSHRLMESQQEPSIITVPLVVESGNTFDNLHWILRSYSTVRKYSKPYLQTLGNNSCDTLP